MNDVRGASPILVKIHLVPHLRAALDRLANQGFDDLVARRLRIAKGSGMRVSDVNRLLKQFVQMRKMMHKLSKTQDPGKAMRMMQSMM